MVYEYLNRKTTSINQSYMIDKKGNTYQIMFLIEDEWCPIPGKHTGMTVNSPHMVGTSRVVRRHNGIAVKR